jgi:antirestriction protein ArdC
MKTDLYQTVTNSILAELEKGAAPWVKPWSSRGHGGAMPRNAVSGRAYSGVNVPLLWAAGEGRYSRPRWLTFKQALDAGGHVRKGEKGSLIVFVSAVEKEDEESGETRRIPFLRHFVVFNVDQCEDLPASVVEGEAVAPLNPDQRAALADEFVAATGAVIREGSGEAFYSPGGDFVSMPAFAAFKSASHFYSVEFHELGHWTGHKSRLARDFSGRFGDQAYAAEELVAELCAAFLCAEFGIDGDLRHAGYIASWIKLLKSDKRAFFTAAAKAQQAADHLRGLALAEPEALAA